MDVCGCCGGATMVSRTWRMGRRWEGHGQACYEMELRQLHLESSVFLFRQKAALSLLPPPRAAALEGRRTRILPTPRCSSPASRPSTWTTSLIWSTRSGAFETYDVHGNMPALIESIRRNKVCLKVLNASKNRLTKIDEVRSLASLGALILNDNNISSVCKLDPEHCHLVAVQIKQIGGHAEAHSIQWPKHNVTTDDLDRDFAKTFSHMDKQLGVHSRSDKWY